MYLTYRIGLHLSYGIGLHLSYRICLHMSYGIGLHLLGFGLSSTNHRSDRVPLSSKKKACACVGVCDFLNVEQNARAVSGKKHRLEASSGEEVEEKVGVPGAGLITNSGAMVAMVFIFFLNLFFLRCCLNF